MYPVEVLDRSYLSKLVITDKFGPVNALVLGRGDVEDNIERVDQNSINLNGRCELRFDENEFIEYQREKVIDAMFEKIKGLTYYAFEASDLGVTWLEPVDCIGLKNNENDTYNTYLLEANITINTGIKSDTGATIPEETETEYKATSKEEKKTLEVERLAKKNEGKIQDLVQQNGEFEEKITKVEQDIDGIKQTVSDSVTYKREISGITEIFLEDAGEAEILKLEVKGNKTYEANLFPGEDLFPSDELFANQEVL